MNDVLERLKHRLIVSCQAFTGDPMDDLETLRRVAASSLQSGAAGLRLNAAAQIAAIRPDTQVPIIGIEKSYLGSELRITPDFASAAALAAAGADIIAMDCTDRPYLHGEPWREILTRIKRELNVLVMADIATYEEGMAAAAAGVDLVGTTLHGYTRETEGTEKGFNWDLAAKLARHCGKPVVAEGNITTPEEARRAIAIGLWCVVVGGAITRPAVIAENFVRALHAEDTVRYAVGVDIGGTAVKAALIDKTGNMKHTVSVPTSAKGGRDAIAASTVNAIRQVLAACEQHGQAPQVIGVASAGAIDAERGLVFAATENLPGWADFDLRGFLQTHFHLPVFVENDAHAAALAELHFGEGRRLSSFVAITVGTGVGGGIVMGGKLQRGALGFGGTIGHQTIRFDGRECNCGRRGCLEAYVSTAALIQEYRNASSVPIVEEETAAALALRISQLAAEGNEAALRAYEALAGYLAEGIANLFNILDPEAVILSGGLIDGQPGFLPAVQARVAGLLHFGEKRKPLLLRSVSGLYAGAQGAVASAFERYIP